MELTLTQFDLTVSQDATAVRWKLTTEEQGLITVVIPATSFLAIAKAQFDAAQAIAKKRRQ